MNIGVLAVQGAFAEHRQMLVSLGADCLELRQAADLDRPLDGLILPGGESTVQGKLLRELGMLAPLRRLVSEGLPTLGTCAGLILLAQDLGGEETHLATLPVRVRRNAYGRQLGSFRTDAPCGALGEVPMTFIRAPYVERADGDVQVLATVENRIVAVQWKSQLGVAFHPELTGSTRVHEHLLGLVRGRADGDRQTA